MRQIDSVVSQLQAERRQLLDTLLRIDRALKLLRGSDGKPCGKKAPVGCGQSKDRCGTTNTLGEVKSLKGGAESRGQQCVQFPPSFDERSNGDHKSVLREFPAAPCA